MTTHLWVSRIQSIVSPYLTHQLLLEFKIYRTPCCQTREPSDTGGHIFGACRWWFVDQGVIAPDKGSMHLSEDQVKPLYLSGLWLLM